MQTLELSDFRNYRQARVEFSRGLNLIVGENAQGKTNLLEAVYFLCALGSHRVSQLNPLIREGADRAIVRAQGSARARRIEVDAEIRRGEGLRARINRVGVSGIQALDGGLASVLFSPEDLSLAKGGPEERRRFLDQTAAQIRPRAAATRQDFERVLRQRNGALKAAQSGNPRARDSLEIWDEKLIETGSRVIVERLEVLGRIVPGVDAHYRELASSREAPVLAYRPSWIDVEPPREVEKIADVLRSALRSAKGKDIERGVTHAGPHRDDVEITLAGADVRTFASQGEQRSVALAMRLAGRDLVADVKEEDPILLLDDVFSELDDRRREKLASLISRSGQTIATATGLAGLPITPSRVLRVESGEVLEA